VVSVRLPARWHPPTERPARILIVRLSALGDVIHALPALVGLRRRLPDARIDWAVEDRCADLVRGRAEVDRVLVFPRRALREAGRRPLAAAAGLLAFRREVRRGRYDVALDLQGNLKSGLVARVSRAPLRVGLARGLAKEGNHLFSTRRVRPGPAAGHRVERGLALVGVLLGSGVPWEDPGLPETVAQGRTAAEALARAGLAPGSFVLLHPGTSRFGAYKRWPAPRFGDLARLLAARGIAVGVSAPPAEEALAAAVSRASGGVARPVPVPDLPTLGAVVRRARALVAADTGPLHLGALAGIPVVGVFGPKDPAVYGPYGRRPDGSAGVLPVVVRDDVACRPCRLRSCADPVCVGGLDAEAVLGALERALASPPGRAPASPRVARGGSGAPASGSR